MEVYHTSPTKNKVATKVALTCVKYFTHFLSETHRQRMLNVLVF